ATLGEAVGDFGMPGEDSTPFGKHDVLIPQRAPYQTLYTTWNVTARDPDDPNRWTVATHGWYKIRQARVVEELGERHTFYWFSEQDQVWGDGDGGGVLPRMFNFAS